MIFLFVCMYFNRFAYTVVVNTIENYTIFVEGISLNTSSIKNILKPTLGKTFTLKLLLWFSLDVFALWYMADY